MVGDGAVKGEGALRAGGRVEGVELVLAKRSSNSDGMGADGLGQGTEGSVRIGDVDLVGVGFGPDIADAGTGQLRGLIEGQGSDAERRCCAEPGAGKITENDVAEEAHVEVHHQSGAPGSGIVHGREPCVVAGVPGVVEQLVSVADGSRLRGGVAVDVEAEAVGGAFDLIDPDDGLVGVLGEVLKLGPVTGVAVIGGS